MTFNFFLCSDFKRKILFQQFLIFWSSEQSPHYLYLVLCSIHSVVDVEGGGAGDGQCEVGDPRNCVHPGGPGGLKEGGNENVPPWPTSTWLGVSSSV